MKPLCESRVQRFLKRAIDVVVGLGVLVFLGPLIVLLVAAATLDTRGWGIFSQQRIGQDGEPFRIHKIRSMRVNADQTQSITPRNDPRVTKFGWILRRAKLDELPQAVNLLTGKMTLIGPRPDVPGFADELAGDDKRVLSLRPGISGPATIHYRDEEGILAAQDDPNRYNVEVIWPTKTRINAAYHDHGTILDDLRMLLITVRPGDDGSIDRMLQRWGVQNLEP